MATSTVKTMPCLFFETQAEEAARHYVSIFPNSSIDHINHFSATAKDFHHQEPGSVMSVIFTLNGQQWFALNSRPKTLPMTEAVSFQILCDGQDEIDHYWNKLTEGITEEDKNKQVCGWLRDRFGVSWQVVPNFVAEVMSSGDEKKMTACMGAFVEMTKIIEKDVREAVHAA